MDRLRQTYQAFLNGEALAGEQVVQLLLLVTLIAASVHLVTMLATRWGDRHIGVKSLIGSILVHAVCLLGLTSTTMFEPSAQARVAEPAQPVMEEQVQIRDVIVESDRKIRRDEHGNVPIFEQLDNDNAELARLEHEQPDFEPPAGPEREADIEMPDSVPLDDVADSPRPPEMASVPEDAGIEGLRQPASAMLDVDDTVPESRSEVLPNTPSRTGTRARAGNPEERVTRQVPRGSVGRIEDVFQSAETAPALSASDVGNIAATENPEDKIARATGPVPTVTELDNAGADTESGEVGAAGARAESQVGPARTQRMRRVGRANDEMKLQREAMTEIPLAEGFDVRESPAMNPLADSVEFSPAPDSAMPTEIRRRPSMAATYRLRNLESRRAVARRNGGTEESERAVEMSLRWLASAQSPEGFWEARRYGAGQMEQDVRLGGVSISLSKDNDEPAGSRADTGITALAVLAFLGAGYTQEEGKYADNVTRALEWLISQQDKDGGMAGDATYFARNYCHAMATYALAEAMGMQNDPNANVGLRAAVLRAVTYTSGQQNPTDGGWRYRPMQPGDVSMFGWQMMSLKSAEIAGVSVSDIVRQRMARFLRSRRLGEEGGLAGYRAEDPADATMTAEAMFCRQMLGYQRDGADSREAVAYLMRFKPTREDMNLYYWYYGTLAMFQYGGPKWDEWNTEVRELLTAEQIQSGPLAGTWDPRKSRWGRAGGRVYTTALATLTLEVYYRFLPLYRAAAPPDER